MIDIDKTTQNDAGRDIIYTGDRNPQKGKFVGISGREKVIINLNSSDLIVDPKDVHFVDKTNAVISQ